MVAPTESYAGVGKSSSRICGRCDTPAEGAVCHQCGEQTYVLRPALLRNDPNIGREIDGRYRIESLIAVGGMGAVYRASRLMTDGLVAVKLIRSDLALRQDAVKRFHREARAMSRLSHPNTVRILDFGQDASGDLFMVMELLQGQSLFDRLEQSPLSPAEARRYGSQLARSLAEAHAAGLIHRDLKPENVFLSEVPGSIPFCKVLDFGIARFSSDSETNSRVTTAGSVVGTPLYMAPEQALGSRDVTPAVDVYSLGVLLYHCLVGKAPYDAPSPLGIMMAHVNAPVPVLTAEQAGSTELAELVMRMMAKDAALRPSSLDVALALESIGSTMGNATRAVPAPRPRVPLAWFAVSAMAAVGIAIFLWTEENATSRSQELGDAGETAQTAPPTTESAPALIAQPGRPTVPPNASPDEMPRTMVPTVAAPALERRTPDDAERRPALAAEPVAPPVVAASTVEPARPTRARRDRSRAAAVAPSAVKVAASEAPESGYERLEVPSSPAKLAPRAHDGGGYERLDPSVLP